MAQATGESITSQKAFTHGAERPHTRRLEAAPSLSGTTRVSLNPKANQDSKTGVSSGTCVTSFVVFVPEYLRISVSCSRADLAAFPTSSSSRSAVHRPSFGRGWTSRSYSKDVSPDRSTLRTVFRDTFRSRAISLIVLPLRKCSRRIRPIVSTVSIPPPPASNQSEQRIRPNGRGQFWTPITPLWSAPLWVDSFRLQV